MREGDDQVEVANRQESLRLSSSHMACFRLWHFGQWRLRHEL